MSFMKIVPCSIRTINKLFKQLFFLHSSGSCSNKQFSRGVGVARRVEGVMNMNPSTSPAPARNVGLHEPPVVVILGSTASGKSKLAIDLAKHVGGEVISADSMQVYEGLDILTNKATEEEMEGVPHHMIGVVNPCEKFDVVKFRDLALPMVEDILSKGKIPFIVGGTNYYIESLLWKVLIDKGGPSEDGNEAFEDSDSSQAKKPRWDKIKMKTPALVYMKELEGNFTETDMTNKWTTAELHQALQEVDSARALKIHPNDIRKIVRSLQVFFRTGKRHSELIEDQCGASSEGESDGVDKIPTSLSRKLGGPLRFQNCFCFWIQAERQLLNGRIEDRVDKMVGRGLRQELDDYVNGLSAENRKLNFQEGQLQTIGLKEFLSYIQVSDIERSSETGDKLFDEGLERLKIVTKQYAKRQVQWMKQRFLKSSRRQVPPVYGLDGNDTNELSWTTNVTAPAIQILEAHLQDKLDLVSDKKLKTEDNPNEDLISRKCEVCDKVLLGSVQWEVHMKSAKHWKVVKRNRKQMENSLVTSESVA